MFPFTYKYLFSTKVPRVHLFYRYPLFQFYWFLNEVTLVHLVFSAVEVIVACLMSCLACLMKSNPVCHGVWCNVPLSLWMQCWDKVHVPFPVILDNLRPFFCFAIFGKLFLGVIKYKQLLPKQLRVFTSIGNSGSFSFIPRDLIRWIFHSLSLVYGKVHCAVRWSLKWTPLHINATVQKLACLLSTWDSALG